MKLFLNKYYNDLKNRMNDLLENANKYKIDYSVNRYTFRYDIKAELKTLDGEIAPRLSVINRSFFSRLKSFIPFTKEFDLRSKCENFLNKFEKNSSLMVAHLSGEVFKETIKETKAMWLAAKEATEKEFRANAMKRMMASTAGVVKQLGQSPLKTKEVAVQTDKIRTIWTKKAAAAALQAHASKPLHYAPSRIFKDPTGHSKHVDSVQDKPAVPTGSINRNSFRAGS